jgi:1-acyl-sn-glycerol-3-phosphate acyltransferase
MFSVYNVLLLAGSALGIYLLYRLVFWLSEGARIMRPGHISQRPGIISRFLRFTLGRLLVFFFIGPVKVIGEANLGYFGRLVALGNHQTERDAIVALWMMGGRPLRYFIASNQAGGLRAPIVAFTGGIVVHSERPNAAAAALSAAIHAMRREPDASFIIFPQGALNRDNELRRKDFKAGSAKLANLTAKVSEKPVAYLPFGIYYDRNPANASRVHRVITRWIGIKNFRKFFGEITYGAVIAVGAPIPVELLPEDAEKATDTLFEQVRVLSLLAQRTCEEP